MLDSRDPSSLHAYFQDISNSNPCHASRTFPLHSKFHLWSVPKATGKQVKNRPTWRLYDATMCLSFVVLFNVSGSFGWLRVRHSGGWPPSRHGGGTATAGGCVQDPHLAPNPGNLDKSDKQEDEWGQMNTNEKQERIQKRKQEKLRLFEESSHSGAGPARMQVWLRDRNCSVRGSLHC